MEHLAILPLLSQRTDRSRFSKTMSQSKFNGIGLSPWLAGGASLPPAVVFDLFGLLLNGAAFRRF